MESGNGAVYRPPEIGFVCTAGFRRRLALFCTLDHSDMAVPPDPEFAIQAGS
jgi:hypothetical protein